MAEGRRARAGNADLALSNFPVLNAYTAKSKTIRCDGKARFYMRPCYIIDGPDEIVGIC
ncbi:hypothetical protein GCM10010136_02890 [Limoniibacter endophyticus]|uniref:Uncharacterized protein n=1 Tax=Limoniibacter endophyticus TaxID=1565040 RepID=A0A8J3DEV7_9HYPH|nr:hypothetical protein GCM10010136_02890 [Limoniibacter endophyticus]